jgi:hypothetical protein
VLRDEASNPNNYANSVVTHKWSEEVDGVVDGAEVTFTYSVMEDPTEVESVTRVTGDGVAIKDENQSVVKLEKIKLLTDVAASKAQVKLSKLPSGMK